jgi:hypothetical protein
MATTPIDPQRAAPEHRRLSLELDPERRPGTGGTAGGDPPSAARGPNGAGNAGAAGGGGASSGAGAGTGTGTGTGTGSGTGTADEHAATADSRRTRPPRRDLLRDFGNLHPSERLLGVGALLVLLGFIVAHLWADLFGNWFYTLALAGAAGTVALVGAQMFDVRPFQPRTRTLALLGFALAPALGFVIETLSNTWTALMLGGSGVMAYAAVRMILAPRDTPPEA